MSDTDESPASTQYAVLRPRFALARRAVLVLRVFAVLSLFYGFVELDALAWADVKSDWLRALTIPARRCSQAFVYWVLGDALRVLFYLYDDVRAHFAR